MTLTSSAYQPPPDGAPHVVIVGGGITGLAAAYYIQSKSQQSGTPVEYTLLERDPSLGGKILSQASAHELFTVIEGPREADGYTWWLLQGVYDKTRQGWAVENYLRPS